MPDYLNSHDPTLYAVSEMFWTIQGEGLHAGRPALFIRLQGCDVGCPWCDTKHSWDMPTPGVDAAPKATVLSTAPGPARWAWMSAAEIAAFANSGRAPDGLAVITGGEPFLHDLAALVGAINTRTRLTPTIETSGTCHVPVDLGPCWITLSPKIGMPPGKEVLDSVVSRADEIKMPVGKQADIDKLDALLGPMLGVAVGAPAILLQPLSLSKKATDLCIKTAIERGWRVSVQQHKYLSIR